MEVYQANTDKSSQEVKPKGEGVGRIETDEYICHLFRNV